MDAIFKILNEKKLNLTNLSMFLKSQFFLKKNLIFYLFSSNDLDDCLENFSIFMGDQKNLKKLSIYIR